MLRMKTINKMEIQSQEQWVLYRLEKFYSNAENFQHVKSILDGKSKISLRLIDWFVTNYSKKYNVTYVTKSQKHMIVYLSYKSHLKAYSKKMFDPFCRWKRIKFHEMETTVGQLNFFEWAITDEVLKYLEDHQEEVRKDMENRLQDSKKKEEQPKKRHELSNSATKSMKHHDTRVTISFD
jgi:hypothetical protein